MKFVVYLILIICTKSLTSSPSTSTNPSTGVIEPHNIEHVIKINNTPISNEENTKQTEKLEVKEDGIEFSDALDEDEEDIRKPTTEDISKLNIRCQQLYKMLFPNKQNNYKLQYSDENRPIYVTSPKPNIRPTYPSTMRPSSYYITLPSGNTRQTIPVTAPIKYIRLEPVILQKTILSNGRTVYYWHKSLPSAVEYPQRYSDSIAKEESYQGGYDNLYSPYYNYYYYPNVYPWSNGGYYNPGEADKKPQDTTTESSTTTTTEESGFGLGNIFPFYGSSVETTTTSTEPPTTTSGKSSELFYQHPMRFVVPVPFEDGLSRSPWGYQPYPYYQKAAPHYYGNYRLPYNSNYQFLRSRVDDKVNETVDDVSK